MVDVVKCMPLALGADNPSRGLIRVYLRACLQIMAWKKNNGAPSSQGPPLLCSVLQRRKIIIICMAQAPFEMQLFFTHTLPSIFYVISVGNLKPPLRREGFPAALLLKKMDRSSSKVQ